MINGSSALSEIILEHSTNEVQVQNHHAGQIWNPF